MLEFVPYTEEWTGSVREFNVRMLAGGLEEELRFPEPCPAGPAGGAEDAFSREHVLAVDGSDVRGAYFLTYETWVANRQHHRVANFRLPLSEGFIDARHKGTGRALLSHALQKCPMLYCLGLGDKTRPLPRLLAGQNWMIAETPFYFRCVHPREVLRNLTWLRTSPIRRLLMDAAAGTGGWQAIAALQHLRTRAPACETGATVAADFADWADELWNRACTAYSLLADRSRDSLRARYPTSDARFQRLVVHASSGVSGWAVLLATTMRDHRHFGNLKVGSIVDCLAVPGQEHSVICAATGFLEGLGVDLIVSNQSHRSWRSAFDHAGFLSGPTNRFFTPSPDLAGLLAPFDQNFPLTHLTRGDGAGPIHL
jgi:hypothetical protein